MLDASISKKIIRKKIGVSPLQDFADQLAVEEPLEIRLDFESKKKRLQKSVSITMRTPGREIQSDAELTIGFLFTEGIIQAPQDVLSVKHCGPAIEHLGYSNVIKVTLAAEDLLTEPLKLKSLERNFYTTSSCGVCGKASIDALKTQNRFTREIKNNDGPMVFSETIYGLSQKLREAQSVFDSTGGLHASALFTPEGKLLSLREDVGRHNALDKLIGDAFLTHRLPLSNVVLMLSGRISFELVQKAAMAGIRFIAAVGAPSSLAVELGTQMHMTMLGFVRDGSPKFSGRESFNIYSGDWRLR